MELQIEDVLAVLANTPVALQSLLRDVPEAWVESDEGPETWSPRAVVGHLIHGERTDWMPRARMILEYGTARPFDPFDRFAQFRDNRGKTLGALLAEFSVLRDGSLRELRGLRLGIRELDLAGMHPELGRVTMNQLLASWVVHDLDHITQIVRVMAKQYADQVGPWAAYLSVLSDRRR